jgi:hypothetical protein
MYPIRLASKKRNPGNSGNLEYEADPATRIRVFDPA